MTEPRINKSVCGKGRRGACRMVALECMKLNRSSIANQFRNSILESAAEQGTLLVNLYLHSHMDGFATCLELILSGKLDLSLIEFDGAEKEQ